MSGEEVLLVHRRRGVLRVIRRRGVRLKETTGRILRARIETNESLSRGHVVDLVLVTVKAYDTEEVASMLGKSARPKTVILSLQNGLGNIEALSRQVGKKSVLAGSTSEAAVSTGPGDVVHAGRGKTWIGELQGEVSRRCLVIKRAFRKAGFLCEISRDINGVVWAKTIVNSAINPISALTGLRNGDIGRFGLRNLATEIVKEGERVASAVGVSLRPDPRQLMSDILSSTRRNKSSMLVDLENHRMTEIRQLNGALSRLGAKHRIATPYNDLLTALVMTREISARV